MVAFWEGPAILKREWTGFGSAELAVCIRVWNGEGITGKFVGLFFVILNNAADRVWHGIERSRWGDSGTFVAGSSSCGHAPDRSLVDAQSRPTKGGEPLRGSID